MALDDTFQKLKPMIVYSPSNKKTKRNFPNKFFKNANDNSASFLSAATLLDKSEHLCDLSWAP